jgi:hypothetical protein
LEQHRDDIGEGHDPEQAIAIARPGLDVGGEVARIDIGDRRYDSRPEEGQE